jgi:hypothetical protein
MSRMINMRSLKTVLSVGAACLLSFVVAATAQDAPPSGGPSSGSSTNAPPTDADITTEPAVEPPRTSFGDVMTAHMASSGEVNVRYEHDDNVLASSLFRVSDNITRVGGRVSLAKQSKRMQFQLHYAPSFRIYADLDERNTFSQQLGNVISYRFSARTTLNWTGSLSDTSIAASSPFSLVNTGGIMIPVFHPSGLQTNARVLYSSGSLGLEHRFTARSTMHMAVRGGTTNFFELNDIPLEPGRANEQFSSGAKAGWNYEFVPGKKIGVEAGYSYFGFLNPGSHSHFGFTKLRYEQIIGRGFAFSVGAGPSFHRVQSGSQDIDVGYAMDMTLSKQVADYQVLAHFARGNSLGSAQGTLTTDQASLSLSRHFLRRWNATGSLGYSRSERPESSSDNLQSIAMSAQLGYSLSPTLRAYTQYAYINQFGRGGSLAIYNFDRNVFAVGIGYSFGTAVRR